MFERVFFYTIQFSTLPSQKLQTQQTKENPLLKNNLVHGAYNENMFYLYKVVSKL